MFALAERSALWMHESTLRQAIQGAATAEPRYALSVTMATAWLAAQLGAAPNSNILQIVDGVPPYSVQGARGELLKLGNHSLTRRHDTPTYHAFDVLAGLMLSRIIEISKPSLARRALIYRASALAFAERLFAIGKAVTEKMEADQSAAQGSPLVLPSVCASSLSCNLP